MNYYGRQMINRFEQVMLYSPAEFRRRIDGITDLMKKRDVETLIFLE